MTFLIIEKGEMTLRDLITKRHKKKKPFTDEEI
jgi:hypothetical protein